MKTFVVGYIGWGDNELKLEKVEAASWREAVAKHSDFSVQDEDDEFLATISEEDFKQHCFDCDCMMSWLEITEGK